MGSLVKAYCHHNIIPFHHYYRPSNLQNPISLFAITSPSTDHPPPSSSSNRQQQQQQTQFGGHLIIPTVAVAASAWFFIRLHQYPPIITASPPHFDLQLEEEGAIKELPLQRKPGHVKALHFYKTKPGTVLKLIHVYASDDNYETLKARIHLSVELLERARRELEERGQGQVMEYSQVVDELMEILKDMEVYVDKCERENVKGYLRSCNRLLARVRKMEARILNFLEEFHEEDEQGGETS